MKLYKLKIYGQTGRFILDEYNLKRDVINFQ